MTGGVTQFLSSACKPDVLISEGGSSRTLHDKLDIWSHGEASARG